MINCNNQENPRLHFNLKVRLTKLFSSQMKCFQYYLLLYLLITFFDFQVNIANFLLISITFSKTFFKLKQIRENHFCNMALITIYDILSFSFCHKSHCLFFMSMLHEIYYEKNNLLKFYFTQNVHNLGKIFCIAINYFSYNAPLFPMVSHLIISNFEICLLMNLSEELSKIVEDYFSKVVEMHNVLDSYPVGILVMKKSQNSNDMHVPQAKVIYANKTAEEILETDILGDEQNKEFISKVSSYKIHQKGKHSLTEDKSLLNEISMFNSSIELKSEKYSNNEKIIIVHLSTVNNKYKILSFENLTEERKKMQNNLYKNLKSKLLITISHELNNPLSGFINYSEKLTSTQFEDIDKKKKILEKLKKFKFYIKFFIKDLTIFSKIILKENLNICPTNLNLFFILTKTLAKFRNFFESKQIKIQSDIRLIMNFVVYYDFDLFKFLLKNLFFLILYKSENNHNFILDCEINKEKSTVQLIFYQSSLTNVNIYQYLNNASDENEEVMSINKSVQTYEMLKEIVSTLSSLLNIKVNFNFRENFVKMEFQYKHIESLNEEEKLFEFSPETRGKNLSKFQTIGRIMKRKGGCPSKVDSEASRQVLEINSKGYYNETDNQDLCNNHCNNHDLIDSQGLEKIQRIINKEKSHPSLDLAFNELHDQENQPKLIKKGSNSKFQTQESTLQTERMLSTCLIDIVEPGNNHHDLTDTNTLEEVESVRSFEDQSDTPVELTTNDPMIIRNKKQSLSNKIYSDKKVTKIASRNKSKILSSPSQRPAIRNLATSTSGILCNCKEILIVDDENFNVNALKSIMKNRNIFADYCYNGQEAVKKVEADFKKTCCRKRYKLIFMDILMPIMDGITASKQINFLYENYKAETANAQEGIYLSIVVISAHDVEEISHRVKGINLVKDFASKPVRKSKIEEFLNRFYYTNFLR